MLVAEHVDADMRDFLEGVSLRGGIAVVPLVEAPMGDGDHTLAIHVKGEAHPTLLIARPAGPDGASGQPLLLRPFSRTSTVAPQDSPAKERDTGVQLKFSLGEIVGRSLAGGKLRVDAPLGSGSAGAVYRATHRDLGRDVAVKLVKRDADAAPRFTEGFQAEAQAMCRLDHPNLVRVFDFGVEPDGLLYISMEYLEGISLEQLATRLGRLSLERAVEIMLQVCAGLWHAHSRGVVHRDVKPSNVMLVTGHDDDGRPVEIVKLCDFGIALQLSNRDEDHRATGTPEYMSPEQCRGAPLDGRSDVYSCGVMLYELVTGRRPFAAESPEEYARQHLTIGPPPPSQFVPSMDPDFERVILRALEKAPEARHGSARELRQALSEILARRSVMPELSRPPPMRAPASSMPEVPVATRPVPETAAPAAADWLEDSRASYDNFFVTVNRSIETGTYHEGDALAREVAAAPAERLRAIAALRNRPEFPQHAAALEVAVKALAKRGDVVALAEVVRVMAAVYSEDQARPASSGAAEHSLRVLHAIADPVCLGHMADRVLADAAAPWEVASALFTWAQSVGAAALLDARLRLRGETARPRFVALMRSVGEHASPVLQDALSQLLPSAESNVADPELAQDLLRSVPPQRCVGMGVVAARYTRLDDARLRAVALAVLAASWGERALPELRHGLLDAAEEVRCAAILGLTDLRAIDDQTVQAVGLYLEPGTVASDELRVAAIDALGWSSEEAKATSKRLVLAALARGDDVLATVRGRRAGPSVILALARAAMSLAPGDAVTRIRARAAKAPEPLRAQLLVIATRTA